MSNSKTEHKGFHTLIVWLLALLLDLSLDEQVDPCTIGGDARRNAPEQ
jgi:hypothetical protein